MNTSLREIGEPALGFLRLLGHFGLIGLLGVIGLLGLLGLLVAKTSNESKRS